MSAPGRTLPATAAVTATGPPTGATAAATTPSRRPVWAWVVAIIAPAYVGECDTDVARRIQVGTRAGSGMAPFRSLEHSLTRLLQAGLVGLTGLGVANRNLSVTVNGVLSLGVTIVPAVLRRAFRIHLDAGLALFVSVASFLHTLGMAGAYDRVWWWDHLTHVLSAVTVGGAGYVLVRAFDEHSLAFDVPDRHFPVITFVVTMLFGVLWEITERAARAVTDALGIEAIWVDYGPLDTPLDLLFDAVGGVVVALFGPRWLRPAVDAFGEWFDRRTDVMD
jgi:hypothetical protein